MDGTDFSSVFLHAHTKYPYRSFLHGALVVALVKMCEYRRATMLHWVAKKVFYVCDHTQFVYMFISVGIHWILPSPSAIVPLFC